MFYRLLKKNRYFREKIRLVELGRKYITNIYHIEGKKRIFLEESKRPLRSDIINYLLTSLRRDTNYLEIGVRNPEDNFNKIKASFKASVDPGVEFEENPVDFKMTSDVFFQKLDAGEVLDQRFMFDVIFIDGLHLAEQAERDISNSLKYIKEDGFIILHDCSPPTEFHASENYEYRLSPSQGYWNGTTWKAFYKYRCISNIYSCCIDTDWGIGIISKTKKIGESTVMSNPYYEYKVLDANRVTHLNLISFEEFKSRL